MASSSAPRSNDVQARLRTAATTICSDNHSLLSEIRKAIGMMKDIAVDLEKDEKSDFVKDLETGVIELLEASDDCTFLSNAIQSVGNSYQPGPERTDFKKLLDVEIAKSKATSSSTLQKRQLLRQFREAIWNVHHSGQPMPGEEQEDIVMTSTQCNLLNFTCPLTGKPVAELAEPVRSMDCKHIYEKKTITHFLTSKSNNCTCPVAGCPKLLQLEKILCDPLLLVELEELRTMNKQSGNTEVIEDFTGLDEEED